MYLRVKTITPKQLRSKLITRKERTLRKIISGKASPTERARAQRIAAEEQRRTNQADSMLGIGTDFGPQGADVIGGAIGLGASAFMGKKRLTGMAGSIFDRKGFFGQKLALLKT